MTFIKKHKWTLIVLCALVVLWTVLEVAQVLLAHYDSSLREQLPALRNQAQVEAIEAKIEFWQPINQFMVNSWGYLIYFFEKACAISGYMLGVNPFNQPGVESYKKNMFALLGKPGYEAQKAELEAKLR